LGAQRDNARSSARPRVSRLRSGRSCRLCRFRLRRGVGGVCWRVLIGLSCRLECGEQGFECCLVGSDVRGCLWGEQHGVEELVVRLRCGWQVGAEDGGGCHRTYWLDCGAESCRVRLVHPRAVDRCPQELKVANRVADCAHVGGGG
jgi:hypothetical protein